MYKITNSLLILLLLAGLALSLGFNLGAFRLLEWDELIYSEISRQMLLRGDYLTMFINNQPFSEKPPLFFWLAAASFDWLGVKELSIRLISVLASLATASWLIYLGAKLRSLRFGLLWALIFGFSLFPSILNRSALIDPLFNFFISVSFYAFYIYKKKLSQAKKSSWFWLLLSSAAAGLGSLTKGPLALIIPFCASIYFIIRERRWSYPLKQVLVGLSLTIMLACSWYLLSYFKYGWEWVGGFINFQKRLLQTSAEGHSGPIYYHLIALALGSLPWFGYIFIGLKPTALFKNIARRSHIFWLNLIWLIVVLLVFSLVQTKLPHYSSSAYIPLAFFLALAIDNLLKTEQRLSLFRRLLLGFSGIIFPLAILAIAWGLPRLAQDQGLYFSGLNGGEYLALSLPLIFALLLALWIFKNGGLIKIITAQALLVAISLQLLRHLLLPLYIEITQRPMADIVALAQAQQTEGQEIVLYKNLYFGPFFYQDLQAAIVGSYKFRDDTSLLTSDQELLIITNKKYLDLLRIDYGAQKLAQRGKFYLLIKRAVTD